MTYQINNSLSSIRSLDAMSPEQRLWLCALCFILIDAIDRQDEYPTSSHILTGAYESRRISYMQVQTLCPMFVFACDAVGVDPQAVKDALNQGKIKRASMIELLTAARAQ